VSLKFGTDGVRGLANVDLTPERVLLLGRVAARLLAADHRQFLVGRDTRRSGPLLLAALAAGMTSEGVDVIDLGVLPTPGVAALGAARGLPAAVISASHNPFPDNGIKLFASGGVKLPVEVEAVIEAELAGRSATSRVPASGGSDGAVRRDDAAPGVPSGVGVGTISADRSAAEEYSKWLVASVADSGLGGLRVAIDCANGAASFIAADVLTRAGAEVVAVLADQPDGMNINDQCGSTWPHGLQEAVVRHGAAVGLAFDGDADRVLAVDELGGLVDGDQLMALFARDLNGRGHLYEATLVVTVMSNLGLRLAMREEGIEVHETPVGDRSVLEALTANGWSLGGEQSGHIIFAEYATTGDGLRSGLQLLALLARSRRPLSELAAAAMQRLPQVLRNVEVVDFGGLQSAERVWDEVRAVEESLGASGRVLLRASGTEPLIRVMVEAPTEAEAHEAADRLCAAVTGALG
jgi:phosphoglucosamine mutase